MNWIDLLLGNISKKYYIGKNDFYNDKINFLDQNECEEWGYCDQLCSNSFGSFKCSCVDGYVRREGSNGPKNGTCVADPSAKKMVLYMAYHNKILAMDQTGQKSKQVCMFVWTIREK